MSNVLVAAPHADDETLGCGGTLLKHAKCGDEVHWLLATNMKEEYGYSKEKVIQRQTEIDAVVKKYQFITRYDLGFPPARLDSIPIGDLIAGISEVMTTVKPEIVYVPFRGDIHTDHAIVFDAVASCTKWFRHPSVQKTLVYETLSETELAPDPNYRGFSPNVFIDVADFLEEKIRIFQTYRSEVANFPFPRSEGAIRALAALRGATSGCKAAEAFMLLKEIVR